ncbi:hypothetical protein HER10_EVM0002637 [Colletotrichum scovillei]|uniref:Uncharacterized protein n=1 Tax=Colletotrichum scovillei TaxID=1209932 RepID=A0A9P7RJQ3_9PEZI|nr:uncharacterized protein HER10_EVM0002637 [Colletotrichum scovillei]KAF4779300.1 hypothetical protein HER10_EVM0002637 [Colletotrichum scovillei]KAG7057620.1 hypothetical protein JMJ77_0005003 [Colletotrichum scovillei]KAG7076217.1 hypothetical protein JMJ76_0013483 [Colletotrichum scovillei]KAG7083326.1 hypothetical protein JMJ78_0008772 [Colletotrichum scovillei]
MDKDTNQVHRERQGENSRLGNTGSSQINEHIPAAPQASMGNTPSTGSVPIQHARQVLNNNLDALEARNSRPGDHLIYEHQVVNLNSYAPRRWMMPPEERRWRPVSRELTGMTRKAQALRAHREERMLKEKEEAEAAAAAAAAQAVSHTQVDNVDDPILVPDRSSDVSAAQGDDGQQAVGHNNKKRKRDGLFEDSQERRERPAAVNVESSGRELDEELDVGLLRILNPVLKAEKEKKQAIADKLEASERKCDDLQKENTELTQNQAKQARRIAELEQSQAKQARTIAKQAQRIAEQAGDIADPTEENATLKASQRF